MARIYRTKVTELGKALEHPESRVEATEALRGLVDAIVLTPDGSREELGIELQGNLAAMLGATVQTKRSPESDDLALQVSWLRGHATGGTCSCGAARLDRRDVPYRTAHAGWSAT
jgi:hypothetical protein